MSKLQVYFQTLFPSSCLSLKTAGLLNRLHRRVSPRSGSEQDRLGGGALSCLTCSARGGLMRIQGETPHGASGQLCAWRGGGEPLRNRHPSINHQDSPPCTDAYLSRNLMHPFDIPFLGHTRPVGRERTREKETAKDWRRLGLRAGRSQGNAKDLQPALSLKHKTPFLQALVSFVRSPPRCFH